MAVRPIDAVQVLHNINLRHRPTPVSEFESGFNNGLNQAMWEITHAPTLTPPNEPLTLEQLREMDGEPVWVELYLAWALVEVKQNGSVMFYGNSFSCSYSRTWHVYRFRPYRRPPEGEGNA